jgi:hypothetical protein
VHSSGQHGSRRNGTGWTENRHGSRRNGTGWIGGVLLMKRNGGGWKLKGKAKWLARSQVHGSATVTRQLISVPKTRLVRKLWTVPVRDARNMVHHVLFVMAPTKSKLSNSKYGR